MKKVRSQSRIAAVIGLIIMATAMMFEAPLAKAADYLYIGDQHDNTVKQFNASTGAFLSTFVKSQGGLHGPMGIVFDSSANLWLSNQNANTNTSGEILLFGNSGKLLEQVVQNSNVNAPFAPEGMILLPNNTLFVADESAPSPKSDPTPPSGVLRRYNTSGLFLGASVPGTTYTGAFHPRGVVLGPDGYVYVTNVPILGGIGGQVMRFDANTGDFVDVFISSAGGAGQLNRPVGLAFGPDGRLYVTSFKDVNPNAAPDNDKILIYQGSTQVDSINLDAVGGTRTYAETLLFGPDGKLFVPINNTGEVRKYDVNTKTYVSFVAAGGQLGTPWFLTFGKTNPSTLAYP